ncbi:hypothetical protein [Tsukamurella tyrosinosolvens]|uniref:hypothetical protein n=1 Tax=Tsukamurella tyrosinosolvens TaxID=57704 RepID=UPI003462A660
MAIPIGPHCHSFKLEFFEKDGTPAGSYSGELRDTPFVGTTTWRDWDWTSDPQPAWWRNRYSMTLDFYRLPAAEENDDFDSEGYWLH